MNQMLAGRTVLITQADAFMGPALCEVFTEQGAVVIASDQTLAEPGAAQRVVHDAGRFDVLIANLAYTAPSTPAVDVDDDEEKKDDDGDDDEEEDEEDRQATVESDREQAQMWAVDHLQHVIRARGMETQQRKVWISLLFSVGFVLLLDCGFVSTNMMKTTK